MIINIISYDPFYNSNLKIKNTQTNKKWLAKVENLVVEDIENKQNQLSMVSLQDLLEDSLEEVESKESQELSIKIQEL